MSDKSRYIKLLLISLFIAVSCQISTPAAESEPAPTIQIESTIPLTQPPTIIPLSKSSCGDGVCRKPENPIRCPADCPASSPSTSPGGGHPIQINKISVGDGILFVGIMVHLEGWDDDTKKESFEKHAALVREYADLFEKYGAKLTLESKEMTEGIHKWGDNVLLEMQQRGHGVGVHADLGGERIYDCTKFTDELRQRKERLEALGVIVQHVSGNSSLCDWVTATADAGYLFTTGQVAYSVMSMPVDLRPPEYRNCKTPAACHEVFPTALDDRIHPWRANSGADWLTNDPNGRLIILSSSEGLKYQEAVDQNSSKEATFTEEDINAYYDNLEKALALSTKDEVNIYYVSWSLGGVLDKSLLETWLQRFQPYIESGRVEWKTLPEMAAAYAAWEN